jgi:hypothetical protein
MQETAKNERENDQIRQKEAKREETIRLGGVKHIRKARFLTIIKR